MEVGVVDVSDFPSERPSYIPTRHGHVIKLLTYLPVLSSLNPFNLVVVEVFIFVYVIESFPGVGYYEGFQDDDLLQYSLDC